MQVLSVQQLYKICTQYWDDKYNTESVSEEVIRESIFFNAQRYSHIQFHFNPDAHGMALAQFLQNGEFSWIQQLLYYGMPLQF